jgi:hypothetical protein
MTRAVGAAGERSKLATRRESALDAAVSRIATRTT